MTILRAVVGSTAYGLAREGSDIDRGGFFISPTVDVAGLNWHPSRESVVTKAPQPDSTYHEIGKALRLMLGGNPTVMEMLWLPPDGYEVLEPDGVELIGMRRAFLSTRRIRDAYGGYAHQQAVKLRSRADGTFGSDTRNRSVKHARHLLRLLRQGRELLLTGQLHLRVPDPESYWAFDAMSVEQMLAVYEREVALFNDAAERSVLPEYPKRERVALWLREVRRRHVG